MDAEAGVEAPFGDWLVGKLRERDMSLSDVARLAQCDYTYLWRLVNVGRARGRQYRRPSYAMAERVGRALGATHEALTAAGYLPAENVRNSRVVDALDRVERQLRRLREELAPAGENPSETIETGRTRRLPLLDGGAWPADPDAATEQIELPAWLAGDATWAVRVEGIGDGTELQPGDLALIRRGTEAAGRLAAALRQGSLEFVTDPRAGEVIGTVVTLVRRLGSAG